MNHYKQIYEPKCINLSAVARQMGVSRQYLQQLLTTKNPHVGTINKCCEILNLTPAEKKQVVLSYFNL